MNFSKPFSRIYEEVLIKTYDQYLHYKRLNDYGARHILDYAPPREGIEGILDQESAALVDKLNITASQITDRLRLNYEHYGLMLYHYLNIRNRMHELAPERTYKMRDSTRRVSALEGQIITISKDCQWAFKNVPKMGVKNVPPV